jgi:3-oxoadipate enol-lactonase
LSGRNLNVSHGTRAYCITISAAIVGSLETRDGKDGSAAVIAAPLQVKFGGQYGSCPYARRDNLITSHACWRTYDVGMRRPKTRNIPADFAPNDRFVDIPGVRIAYESAGQGSSLVFLHGGLLDKRMWDGEFQFFAKTHRAVRYDMRGAGRSDTTPTTEPFTHHEDLRKLLKALKIERVSLIGLSNYAVALDFTIAYPELVDKLVLVSPGLRGYDFHDPWVGTRFAAMMQALGKRDVNEAVEVFLTMWVDGPYRKPEEVNPLVRDRAREMATRSFGLSRLAPNCKGLEPPAIGRLSEVNVPTLIILGEKDAPDIHTIGKLIHERVVGSLVTIGGVGHALPMEKPDEFSHAVEHFLQQ